MNEIPIKGFQGTSLLDFPGKVASLIFFGGCNLACPFCHNLDLALNPHNYPNMPVDTLFEKLKERLFLIDGVVISGGEPTLCPDLISFIRRLKKMELLVKLDTNGLRPEILEQALAKGLVDYVAMDLKTSLERYGELHSHSVDPKLLQASIGLLKASKIEYEFRTTCVPGLVEQEDVVRMIKAIAGSQRWVLQQFVPQNSGARSFKALTPHSGETLRHFGEQAHPFVKEVLFRGLPSV